MSQSINSEQAGPEATVPAGPDLVVAIGASGGSIQSLEALLPKLGSSSRLAVVVVLQHREALDEARLEASVNESGLSLGPIQGGAAIEPGRVYLPLANVIVTLEDGCFVTRNAEEPAGERGTIDSFFVSLDGDQQERAVGVVLGGVGGDGALGVTTIREAGGLTIAEQADPGLDLPTSSHGAADLADFVLEPDQIPRRIELFGQHLNRLALDKELSEHKAELAASLDRIASILLNKTGHDFHGYKKNTFLRRVQRRMQVIGSESVDDYAQALQADRDEPQHLFNDLLIGVTQFFRDSKEFALLEQEVIPRLLEGRGRDDQVRLWVLGCATGEEAYSLAILLRESMARLDVVPHVQIFATDIDGRALTSARVGRFSREIERDVSEERLARWFVREGDTYCVAKELREMCIFSQHNVIKDAPFSRINLVSCRNLLIYLEPELQNRVIPLFHFALQPGGYLFLGNSENVSRHQKLFVPIDRRYRIFRRLDTPTRILPDFPVTGSSRHPAAPMPFVRPRPHDGGLARRAQRIAERYAPAYVITDEQYDVLHFSGGTGRFLDPSSGVASLNLINLVHRDLRLDLRAALTKALERNETVRVERLRIRREGEQRAST
nr:CheR family methyltransferase [Geminicoccus roseus]